jgi:hypothetical protein
MTIQQLAYKGLDEIIFILEHNTLVAKDIQIDTHVFLVLIVIVHAVP